MRDSGTVLQTAALIQAILRQKAIPIWRL